MRLTDRMLARLDRDFGPSKAARARYLVEAVDIGHDETPLSERIQAALLIAAGGNLDRLLEAAALAETDWRDLLVNTDLADEDWPRRVDAFLAPPG